MALLLKCGAVFLHIPKTGGSWVKEVLHEIDQIEFEFGHEHSDMERTINTSGHYLGEYLRKSWRLKKSLDKTVMASYKFCIVRHPFDWYESYWRYMCDRNWEPFAQNHIPSKFGLKSEKWHAIQNIELLGSHDFNEFIKNVIDNYPGFLTEMYGWYTTPHQINYIGKQESLPEDLIKILTHLKVEFDKDKIINFKKINQSKNIKPIWDIALKEKIYKLEYSTFYKYKYDFK